MRDYIFVNRQCPGDLLMLTAAVRDLSKANPGTVRIGVDTSCSDLWLHNPYILPLDKLNPARNSPTKVGYPLIHQSNSCGLHFINGFHRDIETKTGLLAPLTEFKPDLHFTDEEKATRPEIPDLDKGEPYWVITSGGKSDFTAKWWAHSKWQAVVDALQGKVKFVQLGSDSHTHLPLRGVINMVGKTRRFRDAMNIVLHSSGMCTIVTCFMHLAAAMNKPCVCVAGGREPYTWEAYDCYTREVNMKNSIPGWKPPVNDDFVPHIYLHTTNLLPCCLDGRACWRSKIGEGKEGSNCTSLVLKPGMPKQPQCMDMIQPDHVVAGVEHYLGLRPDYTVDNKERNLIYVHDVPFKDRQHCKAAPIEPINISAFSLSEQKVIPNVAEPDPKKMPEEFVKNPVTIMALMYDEDGKYFALHDRLIETLYAMTDSNLFKFRVALNQCTDKTRKILKDLPNIEKIYDNHAANERKYPLQRKMYYDKDMPILSDYVIWLDDDTYFDKNSWLESLCRRISFLKSEPSEDGLQRGHYLGKVYNMPLTSGNINWIKQASWYKDKELQSCSDSACSRFITGGYLVHSMEMFRVLNWPDPRLGHNGGDMMLGVAAHQNGYLLDSFSFGVQPNKAARRGFRESAPKAKNQVIHNDV